jgi:dolichyl-phosphate beta-glucosyltransferase
MTAPELTVVIPAFDEVRRLGDSLDAIAAYLDARGLNAEIVVVDDGSRDGTAELGRARLRNGRGTVLSNTRNRGKGYAVRRGVLAARSRAVLVTDADLSCPIEEHEKLAHVMRERRLDMVIGSRSLPESRVEVPQHPGRRLMGKTFNQILRRVTGLTFVDTQCGFKLLDRDRTRPLFERATVDGFAFDVELLVLCAQAGLAVGDVPVVWRNSKESKVGLVGDSTRMLLDLARIAFRLRAGRDGLPR